MSIANKVSREEARRLLGLSMPTKQPPCKKASWKYTKEKNISYGTPSDYIKPQKEKLRKSCCELNTGKLAIEDALRKHCGNIEWYGEYRFCAEREWRFDYAIPSLKIAIEYEGNTFQKSRHTSGVGFANDTVKYNAAALLGWKILRYEASLVFDRIDLELQMAVTPDGLI